MRKLKFLEVEDLYDAALGNAFRLLEDAGLLLEQGSIGRARALAVIALEESGKAILIQEAKVTSFRLALTDPELDDEFWKSWRTHLPKLKAVRRFLAHEDYWFGQRPPEPDEILLGDVETYLSALDDFAKEQDTSKQAGLYVDVDKATGRVKAPTDFQDKASVIALLRLVVQIGWQVRLGDHIEFIASTDRSPGALDNDYSRYADGGPLAGSRGPEGWEAHLFKLQEIEAGFDRT